MTKHELLHQYTGLCEEKHMRIDGVYQNSNKAEIENAIDCLKCADDLMDKYFTVFSLKYPNMAKVIAGNGDYKKHSHNRLYVFNTAQLILK